MWLLITGGFRGRPIQKRHFWLQGSNERCHGNQFLAKIGKQLQLYASYPCRVWFWYRVCAIREFICDTPIDTDQTGVTMATNFGTEIDINAYKWISARDNQNELTYNGGFRGRAIQRRHFWLQWSKGRRHINQILAKTGQQITKMAITSVVCSTSMQCLVLR